MNYYRIIYDCKMRNTAARQREIDERKKDPSRAGYYPSDTTKDYTESENFAASTASEAYTHGLNHVAEKNAKNNPESIYGFTVEYRVKDVEYIGERLINDDNLTINLSFAIDRMTIFEVKYYRCGDNKTMYFATSAARFNRPKSDWNECGQVQESVLPKSSAAYRFYKEWNTRHLKELGSAEYAELLSDIVALKKDYYYMDGTHFSEQKALSMTIPRNYSAMGGNNV